MLELVPPSHDDAHTQAAARLGAAGARYSAKRRALVDVFVAAKRPLTLPEVIAANSTLAQSSVYRNLGVLEAAGVVHRIVTADDHARFELAEAVSGKHHHHLICTDCGSIEDFTLPAHLESTVSRELAGVANEHGFSAVAHQMDLVGHCATCRAK